MKRKPPPLPFTRRWIYELNRNRPPDDRPVRWYHRIMQAGLAALVIYAVLRALGAI